MAAIALAVLALSGCKTLSPRQTVAPDVTGSIGAPAAPDLDALRTKNLAHPEDRDAAIAFAKALRRRGEADQAAAVMEKIAIRFPRDRLVLAAYGKALIDAGALERARAVLDGADTPDAPDWSVVNARGVIADRLEDHVAAQALYRQALLLAPGEASVLSNYGLSLLLSHDRAGAEKFLRDAAQSPRADDRIRANLTLAQEVSPMARRPGPPPRNGETPRLPRPDQASSGRAEKNTPPDRLETETAAQNIGVK